MTDGSILAMRLVHRLKADIYIVKNISSISICHVTVVLYCKFHLQLLHCLNANRDMINPSDTSKAVIT